MLNHDSNVLNIVKETPVSKDKKLTDDPKRFQHLATFTVVNYSKNLHKRTHDFL